MMSGTPIDPLEDKRLKAIHELKLLDTAPDANFDEIVQLASQICGTPICLVTLLDETRQWFKAKVGLTCESTAREHAFCAYAIQSKTPLVVEDATKDTRFRDNPLVLNEPNIRFYAGSPIESPDGYRLGTLCVIDSAPRKLSPLQLKSLVVLSKLVSKLIELHRVNTLVTEARAGADQSNQNLRRLIEVIAHDLRNPVGGLMGLTDLLCESRAEMSEADLDQLLDLLKDSTHRVFDLLENLLEWSRSETDSIEFHAENSFLLGLVENVLDVVRPMARQKSIEIVVDVPSDLLVCVDERMIASVLRNLLTNAVKFTKKSGRIVISAHHAGAEQAEVVVKDDGVGMEPHQVKRIEREHFTTPTNGTSGEKGSGIGLGLIHNFLQQHKSELTLRSDPDEGTVAKFRLPRYRMTEQREPNSVG